MIHFKYSDKANQYVFLKVDNDNDLKAIGKLKEKMNFSYYLVLVQNLRSVVFGIDLFNNFG